MRTTQTASDNCDLTAQEVINLDRYPIADTRSPVFKLFTGELRKKLDTRQYVLLPDFIRPAALKLAVAQIKNTLPRAHHNSANRNCYLHRSGDDSLPPEHPRNTFYSTSSWMIAADLLPPESPLKTLYYWDNMQQMVAEIVGASKLFVNEDPLQPVNALCYRHGDRSSWHFDSENAFTMTLMLQAATSGGRFEIVPDTRSDDDQNYQNVKEAMSEGFEGVVEVARKEGALCIFRGCNSLHRVSPVEGDRMRMMGVFVYEDKPGAVGDPQVNKTIYGRAVA